MNYTEPALLQEINTGLRLGFALGGWESKRIYIALHFYGRSQEEKVDPFEVSATNEKLRARPCFPYRWKYTLIVCRDVFGFNSQPIYISNWHCTRLSK